MRRTFVLRSRVRSGRCLGKRIGLRHIAAIRQHTGDRYLGAASFIATVDDVDLALLEDLCNSHLIYALRLISEQVQRARVEAQRSREVEALARFPQENPSPVMRISADGTFQYMNRSAARCACRGGSAA